MKTLSYGINGEICKYLSYNDIVEGLKAELFENDTDVTYYEQRAKAKLLAEMAINSSFNYNVKNKNLTWIQRNTLFRDHCKILKKYLSDLSRSRLFTNVDFDIYDLISDLNATINDLDDRIECYNGEEYTYRFSPYLPYSLKAYQLKDVYCAIVQHRFPNCPTECILTDKRKHFDIRDLKSFISPKQVKLIN